MHQNAMEITDTMRYRMASAEMDYQELMGKIRKGLFVRGERMTVKFPLPRCKGSASKEPSPILVWSC